MVVIIIWVLVIIVVILLLFYKFVFLRDPKRGIPSGDNVVAPADGKIINVIRLGNIDKIKVRKGAIGRIRALIPNTCKGGYLITIMMNLFDVHVQRAPVSGVIVSTKHSLGRFKNAVYGSKFENGLENEKNEIIIKNNKIGKINVIQIAGFVARRVECFVKKNQKINKGQRIGRIVMGSQVSLVLPQSVKIFVKDGDKVKAGESIIAIK